MLGTDLCSAAIAAGLDAIAHDRAALDITDAEAVAAAIGHARPDAVVNCAAWTNVDGAEDAPEEAFRANRDGAANVARAAAACGAWVLQVSTDYVFDGAKAQPYVESDPVRPLSVYGRSKLDGELSVAAAAPHAHTVVRSSWLFGTSGSCFPKTILRLASERDQLTVVDDQVGCPTFTGHLATALIDLVTSEPLLGVVHVASDGQCSWFELAREIVQASGLQCEVKPASSGDLDRPAPRPAYSVLRSERDRAPRLPDWRAGLEQFMNLQVALQ